MKDPSALYPESLMEESSGAKKKLRSDIIEYQIIQSNLMKIATYLGAAQGKSANTICRPMILLQKDIQHIRQNEKQLGFFVIIGLRDLQNILEFLGNDSLPYINRIFDICHNVADRYDAYIDSKPNCTFL
jgi:hypothetical protein